jgi:hypothetical protein
MPWRGWSPSALTIALNERANEVSVATDYADAAHEGARRRRHVPERRGQTAA